MHGRRPGSRSPGPRRGIEVAADAMTALGGFDDPSSACRPAGGSRARTRYAACRRSIGGPCGACPLCAGGARPMTNYVDPTEQLVVELYVRDIGRSVAFYERLGFRVLRREQAFAELGWEDSRLFVAEVSALPEPACPPASNVRIMVAAF